MFESILNWLWQHPIFVVVSLCVFVVSWRYAIKYGRYFYALKRTKDLVKMKVMLPRGDSKIDQDKRTEKDFKEKIANMEQLYRALWEVQNLTIWQRIHFWFFRYLPISFEMYAHEGVIKFFIVTDKSISSIVEKQITSFYPDAEVYLEDPPDICPEGYNLIAYNMKLDKGYEYPLRFYDQMADDPLNGFCNVMSKLEPQDLAAIQIVLTPAISKKWGKKANKYASQRFKGKKTTWLDSVPLIKFFAPVVNGFILGTDPGGLAPGSSGGDSFVRMIQPEEELYKRMGEKAGMSFYYGSIRICSSTKSWQRSVEITSNLQVAFNALKDIYGNVLENKRLYCGFFPHKWNSKIMLKLWRNRINGVKHPKNLLVEKELASIFHFPDSRYNKVPNIEWMTYKILPPPPEVPDDGVLIGLNKYRGIETPIRFYAKDRTRHHYIIGKSGSGKSALLSYMGRQDISNGDGMCLIDPHGDLVEDCLANTPKEFAKNVVVFDPSDNTRPMGLNLLEASTPEEKDRASLDAMEIFIKLFGGEVFGPRIQHYFRNGCLTLMDDEEEGATLIDVPRLFVDEEFQRYKVSKCKNAVVRSFWEFEMANTGEREKQEMIPYFSSKFGPFITNTTMRNIIGQPKSAFNIREVMDSGKVLLVNLSKGKIGDTNAQLLGLIFVNMITMAAMGRADMPRDQRRRFYLYVDEFQNFATDAFATILSEARKYELALVMAHQYISQLLLEGGSGGNTKLRDAVFGNVGSLMVFKIGADDSEYMAKEFAPVLSEQDFVGIPNFNAYVKLNIKNVQSRPFSLATIWDESGRNDKLAELIKEYSRMKYGRKKVFVDQEIEDRIGITR